jgi:hypothetical protein
MGKGKCVLDIITSVLHPDKMNVIFAPATSIYMVMAKNEVFETAAYNNGIHSDGKNAYLAIHHALLGGNEVEMVKKTALGALGLRTTYGTLPSAVCKRAIATIAEQFYLFVRGHARNNEAPAYFQNMNATTLKTIREIVLIVASTFPHPHVTNSIINLLDSSDGEPVTDEDIDDMFALGVLSHEEADNFFSGEISPDQVTLPDIESPLTVAASFRSMYKSDVDDPSNGDCDFMTNLQDPQRQLHMVSVLKRIIDIDRENNAIVLLAANSPTDFFQPVFGFIGQAARIFLNRCTYINVLAAHLTSVDDIGKIMDENGMNYFILKALPSFDFDAKHFYSDEVWENWENDSQSSRDDAYDAYESYPQADSHHHQDVAQLHANTLQQNIFQYTSPNVAQTNEVEARVNGLSGSGEESWQSYLSSSTSRSLNPPAKSWV